MKKQESGNKKVFPKSCAFSIIFIRKTNLEIFRATGKLHQHLGDADSYYETQTPGNFLSDESRSKLSQRAKTYEKDCSTFRSILARLAIFERAYPQMLSTASPDTPLTVTKPSSLLCLRNRINNVFGRVDKGQGNLFFDNFRQKTIDQTSLAVETCIKTHCCTHY